MDSHNVNSMTSILFPIPMSCCLWCARPLRISAKSPLCRRQPIDTLQFLSPPSRIHIAKPWSLFFTSHHHIWSSDSQSTYHMMREMLSSSRAENAAGWYGRPQEFWSIYTGHITSHTSGLGQFILSCFPFMHLKIGKVDACIVFPLITFYWTNNVIHSFLSRSLFHHLITAWAPDSCTE